VNIFGKLAVGGLSGFEYVAVLAGETRNARRNIALSVMIAAHVRLVDRKTHKAISQGAVVTASRGTDPGVVGYAIDRAVLAATADALPQPAEKLAQAQAFSGDDKPIGEPGIVLVRLARSTPWGMVQSDIKHLVGARGGARRRRGGRSGRASARAAARKLLLELPRAPARARRAQEGRHGDGGDPALTAPMPAGAKRSGVDVTPRDSAAARRSRPLPDLASGRLAADLPSTPLPRNNMG